MNKKLYIGNLPYSVDDAQLRDYFSEYGEVVSANVITDRATNRSKGFGFVEFADEESAANAMSELDGSDFGGRNIKVSEARPQRE